MGRDERTDDGAESSREPGVVVVKNVHHPDAGAINAVDAAKWFGTLKDGDVDIYPAPGIDPVRRLTPGFTRLFNIKANTRALFTGSIYPKNKIDAEGRVVFPLQANVPTPVTDFRMITPSDKASDLVKLMESLPTSSTKPVQRKLVFIVRHGDAYHMDTATATRPTDEKFNFSLTRDGAAQAINVAEQYSALGLPLPGAVRASTVRRCGQTALQMMAALRQEAPSDWSPPTILLTDMLRECAQGNASGTRPHARHIAKYMVVAHGADRQITRDTRLVANCPPGQPENGPVHWGLPIKLDRTGVQDEDVDRMSYVKETQESRALRAAIVLEKLFLDDETKDESVVILFTHYRLAKFVLDQVGMPADKIGLWTAQAVPVLLEATRLDAPEVVNYGSVQLPLGISRAE